MTKAHNNIEEQLRLPKGKKGSVITDKMVEMNQEVNDWLLDTIDIAPKDIILEIGFGPGYALNKLLTNNKTTLAYGIDPSPLVVTKAKRLNQKFITSGNLKLRKASSNNIPYNDNSFDVVYMANVTYFWKKPLEHLSEIYRVLKPKGKLYIYFTDPKSLKSKVSNDGIFNLYSTSDMEGIATKSQFSNVQTIDRKLNTGSLGHILSAVKL